MDNRVFLYPTGYQIQYLAYRKSKVEYLARYYSVLGRINGLVSGIRPDISIIIQILPDILCQYEVLTVRKF